MRSSIFLYLLLAAVFSLLCAPIAHAQLPASANALDAHGLRSGSWTELFDSTWCEVPDILAARYYRVISYRAGVPVGMTNVYFLRSGTLQWTGHLISVAPDVADGAVATYYENGAVLSFGWREHGLLEGPWRFQDSEGNVIGQGIYRAGLREGPWMIQTEEQVAVGSYVHAVRQGPWRFFKETSTINCDYRDGLVQGVAITNFTDGSCFTIPYLDGVANGMGQRYDANGMVTALGVMRDEVRLGTWEFRSDSGVLIGVEQYGDGKGEGSSFSWNPDASLHGIGGMRDGVMSGKWTFWYSNGELSAEGMYLEGEREGLWQAWYDNGRIRSRGSYTSGRRIGLWTDWQIDGSHLESSYERGELLGPPLSFDSNGKTMHAIAAAAETDRP